jgi:hypothetical protein
MGERALVVFTAKSRETIIKAGGTSSWSLRPGIVRKFKFAVCTRNAHREENTGTGPAGPEPHGTAFLVGRISDVQKVGERNGRDRFLVTFDAIAEADVKSVWDGSRNPVRYVDVADLKKKGIDFDKLHFVPLQTPEKAESDAESAGEADLKTTPLTITQAKQALALKFGVSPESIEITIKG